MLHRVLPILASWYVHIVLGQKGYDTEHQDLPHFVLALADNTHDAKRVKRLLILACWGEERGPWLGDWMTDRGTRGARENILSHSPPATKYCTAPDRQVPRC